MKKIKQISREQYLALAALKMPVYSSYSNPFPEGYVIRRMQDQEVQTIEQLNCLEFSQMYTVFVTLVESDENKVDN